MLHSPAGGYNSFVESRLADQLLRAVRQGEGFSGETAGNRGTDVQEKPVSQAVFHVGSSENGDRPYTEAKETETKGDNPWCGDVRNHSFLGQKVLLPTPPERHAVNLPEIRGHA